VGGVINTILPLPYIPMITKNIMTYKESCKNDGDIMTKLRAIKEVFVLHRKQSDVSMQFGMHRNTLGSLLVVFESQAPPELKEKLQQGAHMNAEEIRTV
jgi:hypothetical protein